MFEFYVITNFHRKGMGEAEWERNVSDEGGSVGKDEGEGTYERKG
jgi:hypothetical protein